MIASQIGARGVTDPAVLAAMRTVPREAFVPPELAEFAYHDISLPIGEGQTISQSSIVALMTAALQLSPPITRHDAHHPVGSVGAQHWPQRGHAVSVVASHEDNMSAVALL